MTDIAEGVKLAPPAAEASSAFAVEQHGIDHIGESERRGRPFDLFWIWFGANLIFTYVIDGAIIVGFGLSFWAAITVAVLGSCFSVLIGLCAIPGARAGTATLAISRSAFGVRGNAPVAFLSWLTAVGWEAVNIVIGALSLYEIAQQWGAGSGATWKAAALALVVVLTFGVAILGIAAITVLNKVFSYVLAIGTVVLGILVLPKTNFHAHPHLTAPTHLGAWLLALLVMAAAPLSWVNTAADYSRYLPSRTSGRRITLWTTLGNAIPAVLITMIGVAAATATDMSDPVAGLKNILPSWFFVGYLAVIVGGTITNNFLNTYSSGMSLLALGLKVKRWQAVVIDATVGSALSIYALFVFDFTNSFIEFLSLMVLWIAPFGGVYLADMLLRRGRYDVDALYATSGRYWFWNGWNLHAVGWFLAGVAGAALFSSSAAFDGPLVSSIGGGDISIYVGLAIPFLGYLLTMRRRIGAIPDAALLPTHRSSEPVAGLPAPSQLVEPHNSGPAGRE